jgi:hypothetical protein
VSRYRAVQPLPEAVWKVAADDHPEPPCKQEHDAVEHLEQEEHLHLRAGGQLVSGRSGGSVCEQHYHQHTKHHVTWWVQIRFVSQASM